MDRRALLATGGRLALLGAAWPLVGCTPAADPSGATTPTASPTPLDLTAPGEARRVLQALCDAAGSGTLLKAELDATSASVTALVTATQAQTWAWRDGGPRQVESDTRDVGQAHFRLADFALDDVRSLFTLAAVVAGSAKGQQLQVVEFSGGQVFMTVTTTPESRAVFFRPDGTLVRPLNLAYPPDLPEALAAVRDPFETVTALGLTPGVGMWAELAGETSVRRRVRGAAVPPRLEDRAEVSPLLGWAFDPQVVDTQVLVALATRLGAGRAVTFAVDRRDRRPLPLIRVTVDGRTTIHDLAGSDVTATTR